MPRVEFLANELGPALSIEVDRRVRLLDVCDEVHAPVAFSCRSASCATCLVEVLEGAVLLEDAEADELDVLALFASPRTGPPVETTSSERLACQAVVRPMPGLVRLRWKGGDE